MLTDTMPISQRLSPRQVMTLGGHGKVALLTDPLLVAEVERLSSAELGALMTKRDDEPTGVAQARLGGTRHRQLTRARHTLEVA